MTVVDLLRGFEPWQVALLVGAASFIVWGRAWFSESCTSHFSSHCHSSR